MKLLRRKIDKYLLDWKNNPKRKPLIVKGARQIGKTESIRAFGKAHYESVIEINFVLQKKFRAIFDNGYEVETIIKNISLLEPSWRFIPNKTLIFFDELQKCPDCATSLKSFCQDKRYDVICSGSMMGIYYEEIESNAVGYKDDFDMFSMDFEEFLWAKGYQPEQIEDLYRHMVELKPFSQLELDTIMNVFRDYMSLGGMPEVVKIYIDNGHFGGTLELQRQLLKDYEEDITKYAKQTDKAKLLAVYNHISTFLAKDNKKYQITKIAKGARNREYVGALEMDFFVRDANSLVPVEVKAKDNATASLNNLIKWDSYPDVKYGIKLGYKNIGWNGQFYTFPYPDVKYGIKLGYKNIGWNGQFYTFPYFLTFLLKRFLKER